MIQMAMLFALGALSCCLVWLLVLPFVARMIARRARARLERMLPPSAAAAAAERDQLRAAHAVALRRAEQQGERLTGQMAHLMAEIGRAEVRFAGIDARERADAATIAALRKAGEDGERALRAVEAALGSQAIILNDAYVTSERWRDLLDMATTRLAQAEALTGDQRAVITELEAALDAARARRLTPDAATTIAVRTSDDVVQMRAAFTRLRSEHDILRKANDTMMGEREKLRFRIDELLLRIEELQDQADQAGVSRTEQRRRSAQQDKTIASLNARLAARDEALAVVKRKLAEETSRRLELETANDLGMAEASEQDVDRDDPAVLRRAIAALAADLVRMSGTEEGEPDPLPRPSSTAR